MIEVLAALSHEDWVWLCRRMATLYRKPETLPRREEWDQIRAAVTAHKQAKAAQRKANAKHQRDFRARQRKSRSAAARVKVNTLA